LTIVLSQQTNEPRFKKVFLEMLTARICPKLFLWATVMSFRNKTLMFLKPNQLIEMKRGKT
jgi:hypothetical protein